jgi:hypothetical protein
MGLKLENARDQRLGGELFEIVLSGRGAGTGIHVLHDRRPHNEWVYVKV